MLIHKLFHCLNILLYKQNIFWFYEFLLNVLCHFPIILINKTLQKSKNPTNKL